MQGGERVVLRGAAGHVRIPGLHLHPRDALDLITGAFTTTVNIVGGTGKYEGAEGQIVA